MLQPTFHNHPIISDQVDAQSLGIIWRELQKVLRAGVPGDIVEFGCYNGTTSIFIRRLLNEQGQSAARQFHVYDSFQGLPEKSGRDLSAAGVDFQKGQLAVSKKQFLEEFRRANLVPPIVHKGWFEALTPADVPEQLAFAFLDGDFYSSILASLNLVWPHMQAGGAVLIDDFQRETLPGVEHAVRDFFQPKPAPHLRREHNLAIIEVCV